MKKKGDNFMYCPNCGKELMEGEVCTCATNEISVVEEATPVVEEPVMAPPVEEAPVEEPVSEPVYQEPASQGYYVPVGAGYYDPNQATQPPYYTPIMQDVPPSTDYPEGYAPKKKYIAVILAATLGVFGIHNFYLGNNSKAVAQLLITIIGSIVMGLGAAIVSIWALVETVQILTDKINADSNNYKLMTFAEELAKQINK